MSQPNDRTDSQKDSQLADFADRVLDGKAAQSASNPDEELLSLERTILRLNDAFPPASPDNAAVKQMLVRLKARVRREEQTAKPSFWKQLFDFQSNPQAVMVLAAVAVLVLVVLGLPALQPPGSSVSGTASINGSLVIGVGLAGVLLLIYFLSRRK